jgi:hypothetical protein
LVDVVSVEGGERAMLEVDGKTRDIPLAAVKEARLAFRI